MIATSLYFAKPFSFTRNLVYTSYILIISCIYKFVNSAFFFPEKMLPVFHGVGKYDSGID